MDKMSGATKTAAFSVWVALLIELAKQQLGMSP